MTVIVRACARLVATRTMRTTNERVVSTLADPTKIVDSVAPIYAQEMGEDWDTITEERKRLWRALAFKLYEVHVKNKFEGLNSAVAVIEAVQLAESTPKTWLRGVQESKNALVWAIQGFERDIETRVEVPDVLPDDFAEEDPYKDLRAGDIAPENASGKQCGAYHDDNWCCTRDPHPDHWIHMDCDMGEYEADDELREELDGRILATWHNGQRLDTLHPALGELEDD